MHGVAGHEPKPFASGRIGGGEEETEGRRRRRMRTRMRIRKRIRRRIRRRIPIQGADGDVTPGISHDESTSIDRQT